MLELGFTFAQGAEAGKLETCRGKKKLKKVEVSSSVVVCSLCVYIYIYV